MQSTPMNAARPTVMGSSDCGPTASHNRKSVDPSANSELKMKSDRKTTEMVWLGIEFAFCGLGTLVALFLLNMADANSSSLVAIVTIAVNAVSTLIRRVVFMDGV